MKVSIIVPVYNVEKYLKTSLDSLCSQTLKDIEIICVDDGSLDRSGKICDEYAQKDHRIKVIHQENSGVARARNNALKIASGEYIGFVDSDDKVDLDFYEKLYNKAIAENLDVIKAQNALIERDNKTYVSNLNDIIQEKGLYYFTYEFCTAIYKNDFLKKYNICFPENLSNGEDCVFLNRVILRTSNIGILNGVFYHYIRRQDSADSGTLSQTKIMSVIQAKNLIIQNLNITDLYQSNKTAYNYLSSYFYFSSFDFFLRAQDEKSKIMMSDAIINLFYECRNQPYLKRHFPYKRLFVYIKKKDYKGLFKRLSRCKNEGDLERFTLKNRLFFIQNTTKRIKIYFLGIKILSYKKAR